MLGLIAGVQFFRNATIDGVIFTVVAIAVVVDATGILPRSERTFRAPRLIVLLPVAAAVAAVLIIAPRHGVVVGILIVAIGVGAVVIAWPNRAPGDRDIWTTPTRRAGIVWSVVALAACAWELTMYLLGTFTSGGRETGPALSDMLDPLADQPVGTVLLAAAWVAVGLFSFAGWRLSDAQLAPARPGGRGRFARGLARAQATAPLPSTASRRSKSSSIPASIPEASIASQASFDA